MLERCLRGLHRAEDALLAGLLLALLLLSVAQIALRLFFDTGLAWAEPVSRSGVFWLAMLGALGATRTRKHIAIDALPRLLPALAQRIVWAISHVTASSLCAALAWFGGQLVKMEFEAPSPWLAGVSSGWPMLILPIGFAIMAVRFLISAAAGPLPETFSESGA